MDTKNEANPNVEANPNLETKSSNDANPKVETKSSNSAPPTFTSKNSNRRSVPRSVCTRYVVIVGSSGSGKSAILNALVNYCESATQVSRLDPVSVTQEAIVAIPPLEFPAGGERKHNYVLNVFDTRGLTDSHQSFSKMVPQWNVTVKRELRHIHFVVFVLPIDRMSKSLLKEIKLLLAQFELWGMKAENVLLVLNKCDFFRDELIDGYVDAFRKDEDIPLILREAKLLRSCFLNPADVASGVAHEADDRMSGSTNALIDSLLTDKEIKPFYANEVILSEERKAMELAAEQQRRALEQKNQEDYNKLQAELSAMRRREAEAQRAAQQSEEARRAAAVAAARSSCNIM